MRPSQLLAVFFLLVASGVAGAACNSNIHWVYATCYTNTACMSRQGATATMTAAAAGAVHVANPCPGTGVTGSAYRSVTGGVITYSYYFTVSAAGGVIYDSMDISSEPRFIWPDGGCESTPCYEGSINALGVPITVAW
jgi:hypothetical protein